MRPPLRATPLGAVLLATLTSLTPLGAQDGVERPQSEWLELFDATTYLVDRDGRDAARELETAEQADWTRELLDEDPLPETPDNELVRAVERRQIVARGEFLSFLDHRARSIFLNGAPADRREIECGFTLKPIEIWTYGARQLVFYRPRPDLPYRLWQPLDTKRALYADEIVDLMAQLAEFGVRRRIDIRACEDVRLVDDATGIEGLRRFSDERPSQEEIAAFLEPPADLSEWAIRALADETPVSPRIVASAIDLTFPAERQQRMVTRVQITLPPDAGLGTFTENERTEHRLIVAGLVEQDGRVFEEFRVRFKLRPPGDDTEIALAFERALRPGREFTLRFRLEDELGEGRLYASRQFLVPDEPEGELEIPVPDVAIVALGEELSRDRMVGRDSLLLVPPVSDVVLGVWRAETLISGQKISKVVFLVDGEPQLTKATPPFTAEVRLAEYPREQVIRAEGYDSSGELVAADEVTINQPRGIFRVRITEPEAGASVSGTVTARAEVVIPEERRVEQVEFRLNDDLIDEQRQAPWATTIEVPEAGQTAYLAVSATLDDGSRAEDIRFLNSPQYLEQVEVNLVELLTTVLDNDRRPVQGLMRGDFTVLEDGRPQQLAKFEQVDNLPLAVGITIDTSGSMATLLPEAQRAAIEFLDRVITPRDKAFAVGFAREPVLLIPPTDDVGAVEAALGELRSIGATALHDAVVSSLYYFRGLEGRKALILLSDGNDSGSYYGFREALEYARRSGVVIYTIGLDVGLLAADIRGKLKNLAKETGGRSFFVEKASELRGVYAEIDMELRSQYLLAYNSDAPAEGEGEFRTVEVKVKGEGKARTIAGYYP